MFDISLLPLAWIWLGFGLLLILLEFVGAGGIGLVFGGIGAVIVAALVGAGAIDLASLGWQFGAWFLLTALAALALWKPLKKKRRKPVIATEYTDIIGDLAIITDGDLLRGQTGHARWSGMIFLAEIDPIADAVRINEGEAAEITHLRHTTLYLRPRGSRRPEEVL